MFLRILVGLAILAIAIWAILYFTGAAELRREFDEPWPYGLGDMHAAVAGKPSKASPEADSLSPLLRALPRVAEHDWIAAQVRTKNDAIEPPPAGALASLAASKATVADVVSIAIASDDRLVWGAQGVAYRAENAANALAVLALERARAGDGTAAWDDVHAMAILASSLRRQRSASAKEKGLDIGRLAVAVARKLPPPAPSWFDDLAAADPRPETAAALQMRTTFGLAEPRRRSFRASITALLFKPLIDRFAARSIRLERAMAQAMTERRCRIDDAQLDAVEAKGWPGSELVYRAARIDAEREAAAKVLALKRERAASGRWPSLSPAIAASRCAGNVWEYETAADGSMSLRMSEEPAWEPSAALVPQLDFRY
jgi:hypothetical protein